jgi:hypothetical protein
VRSGSEAFSSKPRTRTGCGSGPQAEPRTPLGSGVVQVRFGSRPIPDLDRTPNRNFALLAYVSTPNLHIEVVVYRKKRRIDALWYKSANKVVLNYSTLGTGLVMLISQLVLRHLVVAVIVS